MTKPVPEVQWQTVSAEDRKMIEEGVAAVITRFKDGKERSLSDCMDRCAEMEQAALEFCQGMAGEAAAAACAAHAASAGHACVKSCYSNHGVPYD